MHINVHKHSEIEICSWTIFEDKKDFNEKYIEIYLKCHFKPKSVDETGASCHTAVIISPGGIIFHSSFLYLGCKSFIEHFHQYLPGKMIQFIQHTLEI